MNSYDIDGVINMDEFGLGIRPSSDLDVIITGRSYEEKLETMEFLHRHGIWNKVYFNQVPFDEKTREGAGIHKANVLNQLKKDGHIINFHYEDDIIQANKIRELTDIIVILVDSGDLIEKENIRR